MKGSPNRSAIASPRAVLPVHGAPATITSNGCFTLLRRGGSHGLPPFRLRVATVALRYYLERSAGSVTNHDLVQSVLVACPGQLLAIEGPRRVVIVGGKVSEVLR